MSWKNVDYKGSDSVHRVHRIQSLCTDRQLDGILIVGGIDSFHSQASQAALKYLFLGNSGQELLGEQVISQEHERLEDVILLICPQRISVFYSSESDAAVKILPVISKWRHVTEYVVHDGMEPDEQEERKIGAFKNMMASVKSVGVPFGLDPEGRRNLQDTMLTEKWPLVQSYGLEGGTSVGQGFFTMNHQVVNISCELMQTMAQLDDFSAKRVVMESQPFLAHHFDEFLLKLDHAESPEVRNARSEVDMGEDLLSFYEFGTMQYSARGLTTAPNRGSRVLFGSRTSSLAQKSSSSAFLANSGAREGIPATHMAIQAEDPFTGVRFARTYFLSSGKICRRVVDEDALVPSQVQTDLSGGQSMKDTQTLIELYTLLLRGFKVATTELVRGCMDSKAGSLENCIAAAHATAVSTLDTMDKTASNVLERSKFPPKFLDNQLHVTAEFVDAHGQSTDSLTQEWCLLYCCIQLSNVPRDASLSDSLGSLVVGDTFLFHGRASSHKVDDRNILHLTKSFAPFRSWVQGGDESKAVDLFMRTLESEFMLQSRSVRLGKILPPPDVDIEENDGGGVSQSAFSAKATLLLESDFQSILHGSWRVFSGGFVFKTPQFGPIMVSIERNVDSLTILPSPHEELLLLKLELKEDTHTHTTPLSEAIPFSCDSRSLYVPLQSGTRFQEEVFRALDEWKITAAALNTPIYRASDLSEKFTGETPRNGDAVNFDIPDSVQTACEYLVYKQHFVGQDARALQNLFPQDFIPKDPGAATTLLKPNTKDLTKLCVPITIMLGIPGSGVQLMSQSVCKISSSSFEWTNVVVDLRDLEVSKQKHMEASGLLDISDKLSRTLDRIKSNAKSMRLHPRIMLTVIGYIDPITVACAIRRASHGASLQSKISAMINCVSATNVYMPDPLDVQAPFPRVFDQMTAGFATNMVLTNSSDVTSATLQRLRFHMDHVNSFADVLVLSHEVFEGPLTPLLVVDRFETAYYKQYRNAHFPDWDSTEAISNITPPLPRYIAELDPVHTPVTFRYEIIHGMDRSNFMFLIAKTLTPFATLTKSMDKIYPLDNASTKNSRGIRFAQSIAAEKIRPAQSPSTISYAEGAFSNGQARSCWCVEGQVMFHDEPESVYEYRSSGSFARLWLASDQPDSKANEVPSLELKITGQGLHGEKIRDLLLNCYPHVEASPYQIRSKASITAEEKREIQRQHVRNNSNMCDGVSHSNKVYLLYCVLTEKALDPLPNEYMFDGTHYVDFYGGRYEFHPNIDQFINEYISAANDDRKATNLKASEERASHQSFVNQLS